MVWAVILAASGGQEGQVARHPAWLRGLVDGVDLGHDRPVWLPPPNSRPRGSGIVEADPAILADVQCGVESRADRRAPAFINRPPIPVVEPACVTPSLGYSRNSSIGEAGRAASLG